MEVDGRLANRNKRLNASSKSLRASMNVGYLSFTMWSRESLEEPFFSSLCASPASPLPNCLAIFLPKALWSRNLARRGSWRRYWMSRV